jgi:hypothetical protein
MLLGDRTLSEKHGRLLEKIHAALSGSTRDTDVTGWYKNNSILGVICTGFGLDDRNTILNTMLIRLSETLRKNLSEQQFSQMCISF